MKLFQFVKNCYETVGIYEAPQSNRRKIILRKYFFVLSMTLMFTSNIGYFFCNANTISEYGNSFFIANAELLTLIVYLIGAWQIPNIIKLITSYEKFIEQSKQCTFIQIKLAFYSLLSLAFNFNRIAVWFIQHFY